jgi:methylated-DNA-[protein]-cysteine S-methyltransferase
VGTRRRGDVLRRAAAQLTEYFAGQRRAFDLPLAPRGTGFQRLVWEALTRIPHGETRSYRELACSLGRPSACRAVGAANGQNPISIIVPCHRVIASNGDLTGYAGGLAAKRWLLDHERAPVARRRAAAPPSLPR